MHVWYTCSRPAFIFVIAISNHLYQRSSNGCYNCTGQAGPYQPAVKMVTNICSMQIPYSGVVFCVDTLHSITFFVNFIHPFSWLFFRILIQKRFVLWSNTLSQSFQWYRPFSIPSRLSLHHLKICFPKVGIFMRIIWYYGIIRSGQTWSGKCMVHGSIPRAKTKTLPLRKIRVCYFFCAVYHSKKHVIPNCVIAAILDVILDILQCCKTLITC